MELIPADQFCAGHNIEITFINSLNDSGLINITVLEEKTFLQERELPHLEKMIRLYYDLNINIEGIETINHLLNQLDHLQKEMINTQNRLRFYESL